MEELKLNDTPVRTSRNFNINNIKLKNIVIPDIIEKFENIAIISDTEKIYIDSKIHDYKVYYGVSDILVRQVKSKANSKIKVIVDCKQKGSLNIICNFDKENKNLVDNIEIIVNEDCEADINLVYKSFDNIVSYHNGIVKLVAKENSSINITIVNLINNSSNNFISLDNEIYKSAKVNYIMAEFGGKNSIINYYTNMVDKDSKTNINTIYIKNKDELIDMNYICHLNGEKSDVNLEVNGALCENAKKHFKGTLDFKKGSKGSKGNEDEFCTLLSDTARSVALPMLLCSEEDVEGNHSSAAGKIDNNTLFYLMSRGFSYKEAMKLVIKAKFDKAIQKITDVNIKEEILSEIDRRVD